MHRGGLVHARRRLLPALAAACLAMLLVPGAQAAELTCRLDFRMSGWSAFYKTASGTGTVVCSNGQRLPVRIEARGGGLTVGKSRITDGRGQFTGVYGIRDVLGGYASAEAHAGAGRSAKAQVVTKGPLSLSLTGTGEGWDLGVAFGSFMISER